MFLFNIIKIFLYFFNLRGSDTLNQKIKIEITLIKIKNF